MSFIKKMFGYGGKTPATPEKNKPPASKSPASISGGLKQSSVTPPNTSQNNAANSKKPSASTFTNSITSPTRTNPLNASGAQPKSPAPRGSGSPERLSVMNITLKLKATIRIQRCYRARRARKLAEAEQSWKVC